MTARQITTLALDRLGTGSSDLVDSSLTTPENQINVIHQVIEQLRQGPQYTPSSQGIYLVGHSYGASLAVGESATYNDVTGVILSGYAHGVGPQLLNFTNDLQPAPHAPANYDTTIPGTRKTLFFNTTHDNPQAVRYDEATKSTVTETELNALTYSHDGILTKKLTVPTLVVVGQNDQLFCGQYISCTSDAVFTAGEAGYFTDPRTQFKTVPNAGHALNYADNTQYWFDLAARFTSQ